MNDPNFNPAPIAAAEPLPATPPAAGGDLTPPAEASAIERLLGLLKGDNKRAVTPEADPTAAAPEAAPASGTFSQADLDAAIKKAQTAWDEAQAEKERLAKLPLNDRAKEEATAKERELSELKAKLLATELKQTAVSQFDKAGLPVGLADLLNFSSQEAMEESLGKTTEVFTSCLESAINARLKGKTPAGLGGAATAENQLAAEISRSVRGE